jgi:hypothetical protein
MEVVIVRNRESTWSAAIPLDGRTKQDIARMLKKEFDDFFVVESQLGVWPLSRFVSAGRKLL